MECETALPAMPPDRYTTAANPNVSSNATTEINVSHTVHVLSVCGTLNLKYSFPSQNPPSLTCDRISDPAPVASTISSGETPPERATIGATIPHAVVIPTVAEPVATRMSAATSQPSSSGDTCARMARSTTAPETPLSIRMRPNPPPAPTTSVTSAIGPTLSLVKSRICFRSKPRARPRV